jgi:hypothetical protein
MMKIYSDYNNNGFREDFMTLRTICFTMSGCGALDFHRFRSIRLNTEFKQQQSISNYVVQINFDFSNLTL